MSYCYDLDKAQNYWYRKFRLNLPIQLDEREIFVYQIGILLPVKIIISKILKLWRK